jgi:hypothetical protein
MMWTALAIRLFVVINITVLVTFKDVKLGRCLQRSQAVDQKPCGRGKVGNCGFNKDRFQYVAEKFATANVAGVSCRTVEKIAGRRKKPRFGGGEAGPTARFALAWLHYRISGLSPTDKYP